MIKISKQADSLLLTYVPDGFNNGRWMDEKLRQDGKVTLRRTFTFTTGDLVSQPQQADDEDDAERIFKFGTAEEGYYRIDKAILGRQLNSYLAKKKRLVATSRSSILENFELQKFEYIHSELEGVLREPDSFADEKDWQRKILGLLLFIFPKYIAVLENVHIKDFYSKQGKDTDRYIDLMLVDANGNIDIIEVKKPFANALLSSNTYRGNHTPRIELAVAVMQAEKYLFHLSKWGRAGEKAICEKRKSELPDGIELKITNPKAMILLGRDIDFTGEQRFDFEIIRRKYANMIDIVTYDDLLRRLENIIVMMRRNVSAPNGGGHA
jgi:hypothetical protein